MSMCRLLHGAALILARLWMSFGGPRTAGRGEMLMSVAAHVGVLFVCRNCLDWLARAKFFL